jgi:hypothetical protein
MRNYLKNVLAYQGFSAADSEPACTKIVNLINHFFTCLGVYFTVLGEVFYVAAVDAAADTTSGAPPSYHG